MGWANQESHHLHSSLLEITANIGGTIRNNPFRCEVLMGCAKKPQISVFLPVSGLWFGSICGQGDQPVCKPPVSPWCIFHPSCHLQLKQPVPQGICLFSSFCWTRFSGSTFHKSRFYFSLHPMRHRCKWGTVGCQLIFYLCF